MKTEKNSTTKVSKEVKEIRAQIKNASNFSDVFMTLLNIDNNRYKFEMDYKVWDEIKRDSIREFNRQEICFFPQQNNDRDDLINLVQVARKFEQLKKK